ncbi:MAG: hypothetical protein ACFFCM_22325 [Promethearchaeota archaeon]
MKKEPLIFKIDNITLIPKVERNKLMIYKKEDIPSENPIVIIEFENVTDLIKFMKKICFESNIAYYLTDVKISNEISII